MDIFYQLLSRNLPQQKLKLQNQVLNSLDIQLELFFTPKFNFFKNWSDWELILLEKLKSVRIDERRSG